MMDEFYQEIYSRNIGLLSLSEQRTLQQSTIAIAGLGGVGGLLAERLIRSGVGNLKISDPGQFQKSHFNRQFGASVANLGRNKAEVVYSQMKDINPGAKIDINKTGINTSSDADHFVNGCDLVIDEIDFGLFKQSIYLQRAARRRGKYYFFTSALGFGALIVIFSPQGQTLEEFDNIPPNIDLETVNSINVPLEKVIPVMPSYAPPDIKQILESIYKGASPPPSLSIGVGLASLLATNEALNILLRRREISDAPYYTYVDLMDRKFIVGKSV